MRHELEVLAARPRVVGLAIAGFLFLAFAFVMLTETLGWGFDFEAYFWAAQRIARTESPYWDYTLRGSFNPGPWGIYLYAPPLAVALVPFTILSQASATILWFLIRVALLAIGCWAMPVRPTIRLTAFAVAAFSQPVLVDLLLGNVSVIVMVLLAFAWRFLDRPLGSVAVAVAMSVRPTLGILLFWWALRRRWLPIAWTVLAGLALIALTLPAVGVEGYQDYLTVLRNVSQVTGVMNNLDLATTVLKFNVIPEVATAALVGGYALAVGASLWSLRYDRDLSFMVTISSTMLLAPLLWDHYLALLLLPGAFLAQRGRPLGLALPLLGWLPDPLLPFVVIAGTLAPFFAERLPPEAALAPAAAPVPVPEDVAATGIPEGMPAALMAPADAPAASEVPSIALAPAAAPAQALASVPTGSNQTSSPT